MNSSIDVLFLRKPKIDYISPPVCEVNFSSSSGPVIVLNPLFSQVFPTGLILGGVGGFFLSWSTYPGALCYSVYKSDSESGTFTIVAECIPNPPIDLGPFGTGCYRITAITLDGETPPSEPVCITVTFPPSVITDPADNITAAAARLNGFVFPNLSDTTVFFEWGVNTSYGNITAPQNVGLFDMPFLANIAGLSAVTTYHFRAVAFNMAGTVHGADEQFVTLAAGGCPAEVGTDTPCDLTTPDNTALGNVSIADITILNSTTNFGSFPIGLYRLEYVDGCYSFDGFYLGNPVTIFTAGGHAVVTNLGDLNLPYTGPDVSDPPTPGAGCGTIAASQAGQFLDFGFETNTLAAAPINLKFNGWGGYGTTLGRANGAPNNPRWQLRRIGKYPTWPARLRIRNFDPTVFSAVCSTADASAAPAWDGTFPDHVWGLSPVFNWRTLGGPTVSLNGLRVFSSPEVFFTQTHPTNGTSCGWKLEIGYYHLGNFVNGWSGFRGVGDGPVGYYYLFNGCQLAPLCLYIESY